MAEKKDHPSDNPFNFGSNPDMPEKPRTPQPDDSDDSILDFGAVASVREGASGKLNVETLPDPQSSPSLISWTDVIRQQRETVTGGSSFGEPVKIDSSSDKDLLKRIVAEEHQRKMSPGERDTDKLSQVPLVADDGAGRSGSSVQLGNEWDAMPPQQPSGSAVQFDLRKLPDDAGGAMPMPWTSDSGVMEAIPLDDAEIDDEPVAEALSLDDDEPIMLSLDPEETAESGGSVARFIQDQNEDALLDIPPGSGSGITSEQSSVLDFLLAADGSGRNRPESGIVDLASAPGSGVLSGLSSRKRLVPPDDKFIVPDVQPSSVEPGNSWMRDALKHAQDEPAFEAFEVIEEATADETVAWDVVLPAEAVSDSWTKAAEPVIESFDVIEEDVPAAEAVESNSWTKAAEPAAPRIGDAVAKGDSWTQSAPVRRPEEQTWHTLDIGEAEPLPPAVDTTTKAAPQAPAEETWNTLDVVEAAPLAEAAGDSWTKAAAPPAPAEETWNSLDVIEEAAPLAEAAAGDSWTKAAAPVVEVAGEAWDVVEAAEVIEDDVPAAEAVETAQPIDIDAAWDSIADDKAIESFDRISDKLNETSPARSTRSGGDSAINKRTMASFQLPDENPEDAVDLYSDGPFNRGISDSGSLQITDEELAKHARMQKEQQSSSIDLSSKHTSSMFEIDVESATSSKALVAEDLVDLSLPAGNELDSSMIRKFDDVAREDPYFKNMAAPVEETEEFIAAEVFDDEPSFPVTPPPTKKKGKKKLEPVADDMLTTDQYDAPTFSATSAPARGKRAVAQPVVEPEFAEAEPVADEPMPARAGKSARPAKERKKRGGMLIGTTFGLLLGAGGLFAAMYFDALPDPKTLLGEDSTANTKPIVTKPPTPNTTTPPVAVAETPASARALLEAGNPAKAATVFAKLDQEQPDVLAGRGQAEWLAYLQKAAAEDKPLDRDSEEAKAAIAHLQAAVEKAKGNDKAELDAARAFLWQGLIAELFDDDAAAERIYTDAEMELKSDAALAPIRAAGNRLKVLRPQSAPLTAIPAEHLLLAFTLLLADPTGTPKADEPAGQEAGYLFWEALLLASKHQYAEAAAKIPQIKAVHARQQVKMAGRGLNPLSDPREQLTPFTLDELARLWTIADQLYKRPEGKMLVEQRKLSEALAAVFAKSKDNDDAMKLVAEKLMLKADEKPAEAIQTLITAKTKAEDEKKLADDGKKAADDMLVALGKSLKDAGIDDPKIEEGLKKALTGKADAETKVKDLDTAIEKAGIKEPDTAKALALLVTSRDEAEAIIKTLRQRFEKAKYIEADATKEAMLKAIDEAIARGSADAITKLAVAKKDAEDKAAKLEADADKVKKDADAAIKKSAEDATAAAKKANDDAAAATKKANDDAAAAIMKVETTAADQKAMYEDRLANNNKNFVQQANKAETALKAGNYDAALKDFTTGVKSLKALPKEQEDLFDRIISTHPALQRVSSSTNDASLALKHYGQGLELFRAGQFDKAEEQFGEAVRFDNRDARYRYFLGMSRYEQGKTTPAIEDLKAAANLEMLGRPTTREINSALQSIQGATRGVVEKYRP